MLTTLPPDAVLQSHPTAVEAWGREITALIRRTFRPDPHLTLSEWADKDGYLSDGTKWNTSVVPYLREIMDATTDRRVREIVVMKPSRVGYTEGVLGQRVGYRIHQDPGRILVVQPTAEDAKDWSQKQLRPMIEAAPALREVVPEARSRTSGNTITDKVYPGGSITIRGAHSPKGLRRHTADDVILDEVDGFEATSRDEGDPVLLATRANRTVPDRKTIMGSTPKMKFNSRIYKALKTSDWREYHVPCPHCKKLQVLEWGGPDKAHGIKWAQEIACKGCGDIQEITRRDSEDPPECACGSREFETHHKPETAHYVCRHCEKPIDESHKPWMLQEAGRGGLAKWIPRYPGRAIRGFHIHGTLSPFEGANWANMVTEFLRAKDDPAQLQVWVNQWLGEPFEDRGQKPDATALEARAVVFVSADGEPVEVPDGVGILTAGVDVQGDRLELLVRGYGARWETWDILHERIYGVPQSSETWARLDHYLSRAYRHEFGGALHIAATMIDSGDGNTAEFVYRFVKPRKARNVWASKGDTGAAGNPPLKKPVRSNADGVGVWSIGTFAGKASLFYRLAVERPGANYIHLRAQTPGLCNGFDGEYFAQFGAEEKKRVRVQGTARYEERFIQTRARNEAIDLHVLADSAYRALGAGVERNMQAYIEAARERPVVVAQRNPPGPRILSQVNG